MVKTLITTTSKNYSKALYQALNGEDVTDKLNQISDTIRSSNDLKIIMSNSSVSVSKKTEILDMIFKDKIDGKLLNLLKILATKNRFSEFDSIKQSYYELVEEKANKKNVEIISAIELDDNYKKMISEKLSQKLSCEVIPTWQTDKSLIAGLVFKYDDSIIDTSLATKLKNLSKNITV